MKRHALLFLAVSLLPTGAGWLFAAQDQGDAVKKELEKLQGTWKLVSGETNGEQFTADEVGYTITFTGDKFVVKRGNDVVRAGTQKLDPTKEPRSVDAQVTEGEGRGTTMLGIYELDGDTLKACFDPNGKKRPTEFKTSPDSGLFLNFFDREKSK
jgi:uncharacterized protein (TIGR03067 family)